MEAFLARAVLLKQARHSIDLQYYIWKDDVTGKLLYSLLIEAAERGVKIRLLLDDLGSRTPDRYIAALSAHENIEVRLFNPFTYRSNRLFNFIIDFNRLNRRMHNKLFIFDQQVAIVGGRNIGDAYFQASSSLEFNDFDVFIIGNVISQATDAFDHFWLDDSVYDASSIIQPSASSLTTLKTELDEFSQGQNNSVYIQSLKETKLLEELLAEDLKWHWSPVNLIYDKPDSEDNKTGKTNSIVTALNNALADTKNELLIVSPYFVPGKKLVEKLAEMIKTGVKVTILTNSLASTDVTAVHAGYKKYRASQWCSAL
ncbi:MAG: phospholipase D-like domain-containing protein [Gammaproteobacteria bacterium]